MRKILIALLCLAMLISGAFQRTYADDSNEDEPVGEVFSGTAQNAVAAGAPVVAAASAIVMDMDSGRILYEKNANVCRAMASTTKIMTAILAIEKGNPDDIVTVSKRAATVGGSTVDLREGQKIKLGDLMYGLMLSSGNDAAVAIAEHIGGNLDNFLNMMNNKAQELGLVNTCFKSPHGLDAPGHQTTAYELAMLTKYALSNEAFSKIVGTKSTNIPGFGGFYNTNEMLDIYQGADGVKTGYTGQAGRCLVTSVTRDNWRIISVVLGCATRNIRARDSTSILDYVFKSYKRYVLQKDGDIFDTSVPVVRGIEKQVKIRMVDDITMPLKPDEYEGLEKVVDISESLDAPVGENIEVGTVEYVVNGNVIAQSKLVTAESIRKKVFADYVREVLEKWGQIMHPYEGVDS